MRHGLIRFGGNRLPPQEMQAQALQAAGVASPHIEVVQERPTCQAKRPAQVPGPPHNGLAAAIRRCRAGDELAVSHPGVLALGLVATYKALAAVAERGAQVWDCSTGRAIASIADAEDFAARSQKTWKTNWSNRHQNGSPGRGKAKLTIPTAEAERLWRDPTVSRDHIAERCGVQVRTLYNHFGPRMKKDGRAS